MKKKERIRGIVIAIILILIAIISIVMIILMKKGKIPNIFKEEETYVSKRLIEELDWDTEVVANITTDYIPMTRNLSYVSGNIQTGTIMEDENGCYYLWIPYDENASADIDEYFKSVSDYYEIESDEMASIEKYKGFYVALNMSQDIESLKTITNEDYVNYAEQVTKIENEGTKTILSKEQIEQILNYINSSKFDIADNTIGIEGMALATYSTIKTSSEEDSNIELEEIVLDSIDDETMENILNNLKETIQKQNENNNNNNNSSLDEIVIEPVEDENVEEVLAKTEEAVKEALKQKKEADNSTEITIEEIEGLDSAALSRVFDKLKEKVEEKKNGDTDSNEIVIEPMDDIDDEKLKDILEKAKEKAKEQYKNNNTGSSEETIYVLKTEEYPEGVPIPANYRKNVTNGIVTIQDANNENLIYVWVPLSYEELTTRKQELNELYKNYTNSDGEKLKVDKGSEIYDGFNNTSEELPEAFVNSIKKWGGFYISEAEMGYDSDGKFYNKARGMVDNTVTKTIYGGDYYRGSTTKNFTFENVKALAESVTSGRTDVVSHLTYGVEYDATILWINKTNQSYTDSKGNNIAKILLENSTYVGKYTNSNRGTTATAATSSAYINKIWGLGGNLAELTQERAGESYVIRGGSWSNTGEDSPIASRKITNEISSDKVGFRTCLYINENLTPTTEATAEDYEITETDDTTFCAGDYTFDIWSEKTRFVKTWDGLKVYSEPNTSSDVLDTLGIASIVIVNAKAKEKDTSINIWWARIKLSNGSMGYINANLLTDTTTNVSGHEFVMKEKVTRYHNNNLNVYTTADESSSKLTTIEFTGAVEVIGKSTDFEWAVVRIDGKTGYVKANDLRVTKKAETIGNYSFFIGDEVQRTVSNEKGANLYQNPGDTDVTTTIEYGTLVTINAITEDGEIARTNYNGEKYYIYTSDLSLPGPTLEVSINKDTGIATIKAKNIGRGVKAIYKDGKAINGSWKNDYYVVAIQTYKDNKYNITAEDEQGNISVYGYLKTSDIKVEDPNKKPVETTTPTTSTGNSSSNSGSSGNSSSGSSSANSGSSGSSSSGSNSSGSSSSNNSSSNKDTEAPVAKALYYTYDNKSFTQIKDGDTIKATKEFHLWIQVEDNMVSGKNLYAYKTSAKKNDRISEKISSTEGSGNYKGLYYIVDTISANGTYYYQLCDGSANSPYSYVSVKVQGISSSSTGSSSSNKDTTAPKITYCTASCSTWTNKNVTITMKATDNVKVENFYIYSPIAKTEQKISVKKSGGNYYCSTATISKEGVGYYTIYAKDSSGNASEKKKVWIAIDKTAPTFDFDYHTKNTTTTKQKVKCYDSLSGVKEIKQAYKSGTSYENMKNTTSSIYEWDDNVASTKWRLTIYDKAGNSRQVYIKDKKASYTESGL